MRNDRRRKGNCLALCVGSCLGFALPAYGNVDAGPFPGRQAFGVGTIVVVRQVPESEVMTQQLDSLPGRLVPGPETMFGDAPFGRELSREQLEQIDQELLSNILEIEQPGERTLALVRAARFKILEQDFPTAQLALDRARTASLQEPDPRLRDLRIMSVVDTLIQLAEAQVGEATADPLLIGGLDRPPSRSGEQRLIDLRQANDAFNQAAELSTQIRQPAYQSEKLFKVVERQAASGQSVAVEVVLRGPDARPDLEELFPELRQIVDRMLVEAAGHAWNIHRLAWRDQGLLAVATSCSKARQFDRSLSVASSIPSPVVRSEAFIRIAETETRRSTPEKATLAYSESARAISAVPIDDLRATLTNVLIDSLVSSGRFIDARACIPLYPDEPRRIAALGAIAESQGRRGLGDEARQWIAREVRPEHRSLMYRRVNDGVLYSLERYRTDALMRQ